MRQSLKKNKWWIRFWCFFFCVATEDIYTWHLPNVHSHIGMHSLRTSFENKADRKQRQRSGERRRRAVVDSGETAEREKGGGNGAETNQASVLRAGWEENKHPHKHCRIGLAHFRTIHPVSNTGGGGLAGWHWIYFSVDIPPLSGSISDRLSLTLFF